MFLLVLFAFIAGIVTVLSPCVLPLLPIILSGSVGGRLRPLGIITGFVVSFTFFTLFLSSLVKATGISPDALRVFSVFSLVLFGLALLWPGFQVFTERLFSKLSSLAPKTQNSGYLGGVAIGLSLGLIWTPCVGPILASVISLALSGSVDGQSFFITLAYALGTAIPMFAITIGGRALLQKNRWLLENSGKIQKLFGVLMILTAVAIHFNLDRKFQTYILEKFPSYGVGLTKIEDNPLVKSQLQEPKSSLQKTAPELIAGGQWFNSSPLKIQELKGKVVLVDFWTYTCINCIRTIPYLRTWYDKYKDQGLVIIGVHTPEFEFEKNPTNVQKAIADFKITYPVVQDNNFATWNAYSNRYWPAKYLLDKSGKIVYTHFGEGEYDETEQKIQELLSVSAPISNQNYTIESRTPELYLGSARTDRSYYTTTGIWDVKTEYAEGSIGSTITLDFESKDVFLVMRPTTGSPGQVQIMLDGQIPPAEYLGEDVTDKANGIITIPTDKLYRLIKLPKSGKHVLKLIIKNNVQLFAFTFG